MTEIDTVSALLIFIQPNENTKRAQQVIELVRIIFKDLCSRWLNIFSETTPKKWASLKMGCPIPVSV